MEIQAQNPDKKNFQGGISDQNIDKMILMPTNHIRLHLQPCNTIYLAAIQVLSHWIKVPEEKLAIIKNVILNLNTYSIVDDILDDSTMREGLPATYKIFGIANSVNSFDFVLNDNLGKILELNHPKAVGIYLEAMRGTFYGQGIDIYWRDSYACPTVEEFLQNAGMKTGSWLLMLARLMQLFDNTPKDVERLLLNIGVHFQIRDDYNCLTCPKHFESKGTFCEDITEGKFSFPIVHAINSQPEVKDTLIDIMKQRTTDIQLKKQFVAILEECGSFEYTRKKMKELKCITYEEVHKLGENPYLENFLEYLRRTN